MTTPDVAATRAAGHIIELRERGFTILHPLACRPNLFACPLNSAARSLDGPPVRPGRYLCQIDGDGNLVIGDPTDRAAGPTDLVLIEVAHERQRQDGRRGEQNHRDGTHPQYVWAYTGPADFVAESAQSECQRRFGEGYGTWRDVLLKEVAEAFAEEDSAKLRAELVQVAAVAVAWIEAIDRRAGMASDAIAGGASRDPAGWGKPVVTTPTTPPFEESAGQLLERLGTDAVAWATEFRARAADADEATLISWFAGAIETGRSAGISAVRRTANAADDELRRFLLATLGLEDDGSTSLMEYVTLLVTELAGLRARAEEADATIVLAQEALDVEHPAWMILEDYDGTGDNIKNLIAQRDEARKIAKFARRILREMREEGVPWYLPKT